MTKWEVFETRCSTPKTVAVGMASSWLFKPLSCVYHSTAVQCGATNVVAMMATSQNDKRFICSAVTVAETSFCIRPSTRLSVCLSCLTVSPRAVNIRQRLRFILTDLLLLALSQRSVELIPQLLGSEKIVQVRIFQMW